MNNKKYFSLRTIFLSWSAGLLLITLLLSAYWLIQGSKSQLEEAARNQIEADTHSLLLILQQQISDNEWRLADKTLSFSALNEHVVYISLFQENKIILSTRRAEMDKISSLEFIDKSLDTNNKKPQLTHSGSQFYALIPLVARSNTKLRENKTAWIYAHYDFKDLEVKLMQKSLQRISILFIIFTMLTVFLNLVVKRQVLVPLRKLIAFAQEMMRNEPGETIDINTRSKEFKQLTTSFNQLSQFLQQSIEYIDHQADYDNLTNLTNRRYAINNLENWLQDAKNSNQFGAVLFIDLDHFKTINDSLGHAIGDKLLLEISQRLAMLTHESENISRLSGDEFLLTLSPLYKDQVSCLADAQKKAEEILATMRDTFNIDLHTFHLSCSVGVALYPVDQASSSDVIRQADTAMHNAKSAGRGLYKFYTYEMQKAVQARHNLFNDLHKALEAGNFTLVFQPQINDKDQLVGAEVLCRWTNNGTPIRPDIFIAAAEETGLIIPLGTWILQKSCEYLSHWKQKNILPSSFQRLAINISPAQFLSKDFTDLILRIIKEYNLSSDDIELEITESIFVDNKDMVRQKMHQLCEHGFTFAMDDFGTGYSSLNYLQHLPLHKLKIDRSFVIEITPEKTDAPLVNSIIQLGTNLNMKIIAEGVETEQQRDYLLHHNCPNYQGYLFSKPLTEPEFLEFIEKNTNLQKLKALG
ncbi:MAG: EAL domain-containing protein [Venatoribacter sp.]